MATLNTSTNGPSIKSSYQGVVNSPAPSGPAASSSTYGQWALFSVSAPLVNAFQQDSGGKESVLKVQSTGEGELLDLIEDFSEGRVQFAFVKVKDPNTTLPKYALIGWCGEGVPERTKGYFTSHLAAVSKILHGYHVQITARSDRDLTPESIISKVEAASGAKYSAGSAPPPSSSGPPPPVASKPAFNPTRSSGAGSFNPLASSRTRPGQGDSQVDEDGWGADAPQVTRSQLEKVAPAYKPTKVNMAELTKQPQEPSRFNGSSRAPQDDGNVVKGGYQPIGKVDIAALRAQAKNADDRPTIVKGAYEPVGKVDIAAIRARAQKPSDAGDMSPAATGASTADNTSDEPKKSLAERSAAFTQSERLTTLPKPKVANKFGASANFTGTKAPTPGQFGLQSAPSVAAPAPVGAASRTFADDNGMTPAQQWAAKKARERGLSGAGSTSPSVISPGMASPMASQKSGGGEWKSGYTGKSWGPVAIHATGRSGTGSISQQRTGEEEPEAEAPASPAGGIGALKDRFQGGAPMGAPALPKTTTGEQTPPPPPINASSRPTGGVPMPGLPPQPIPDDDEEQDGPNIPPPPRVQRSPTPPTPEAREVSPVRIAMPVARSKEPELEAPEERNPPPALPEVVSQSVPHEDELTEEPAGHDPARGAGAAVAAASFGAAAATAVASSNSGGKRAVAQYDYEKAEDNELELVEGEYVINIEMVDEDWWMGTNAKGESGLFPSNYVELVEGEEEEAPAETSAPPPPPPAAAAAAPAGPTATSIYDYEAAEDNELSFAEGTTITDLEFPDEDWWFGHQNGKSGLFPANYVQLDE
ncbi:hypothetical protein BP6252_00163 [Coleophoma cylindrospora]|uniref:Actin binding protein n=1 Tax=Coleophoma cylindrospora TaxID=1849047 RepID=A0A3D8SPM8_9HELO|nr:hypothetical protein BP6252_00163 [Coleophoma cylindrospora]